MKKYPKVLVISHNAFSKTQNNGKTLKAFFKGWPKENLAQIYFMLDEVDLDICDKYYRITDVSILKSFFKHSETGERIDNSNAKAIKNSKYYLKKGKFFVIVRDIFLNGSSVANLIREFIWICVKPWKRQDLNNWIKEFNPDLIFFQTSIVPSVFNFVYYISNKYNLPIIAETTDDYVTPHFSLNPFYLIDVNRIKKVYSKLAKKSDCIFAIGEMMANEYQNRFGGNFKVAMNSIEIDKNILQYTSRKDKNFILTYAGNLELNRWKTLVKLAKNIDEINRENGYQIKINVYTPTDFTNKMKKEFSKCECLFNKGCVDSKELNKIRANSDFLIHVESFDRKNKNKTRLSISTKIPEYLLNKRCILAIGPSSIASIKYIKDNHIGHVISENDNFKESLLLLFNDNDMIQTYLKNADDIAIKNHSLDNVANTVQEEIFKTYNHKGEK